MTRISNAFAPALLLSLALATGLAPDGAAQSPGAQTLSLTGQVADETGAILQAVNVRVFEGEDEEPLVETVTSDKGTFVVNLPQGDYRVEVSAPDFSTWRRDVRLAAETAPLAVTLTLAALEQAIDISTESEQLIADTTMSLSSVTLSGDELLDLPDNEDDLVAYLQALAGVDSTGDLEEDILANFVIDGFDERRLPRSDQIAQIIIDPNSLSADGRGPRIEIITRPGTGTWRRSLNFGFADESLNALTPGETSKPARQTRDLEVDISGPIIPNFLEIDVEASTRSEERAGNSLRAITPARSYFAGVVQPQVRREFGIEGEMDLGGNHSLEVGFRYGADRSDNSGVGGFTLDERGYDGRGREWSFQISDRIFGDDFTNDLQIEIGRDSSWQVPLYDGFAIDVADAFNGGGGTQRETAQETAFQLEERLRLERGSWNLQLGGEVLYRRIVSDSQNNFNGTFEFASLHDYCYATDFAGINCQATRQIVEDAIAAGIMPAYQDARGRDVTITGVPTTFTQASGNSRFEFNELGFNAFFQADRQFGDRASLRMGVRYEATNHSLDYWRVSPTVNLQYRLFENTLVSLGSQLNFSDFRETERLLRNDGSVYRRELSIFAPSFPDPFQSGDITVDEQTSSLYVLDPDYTSPYSVNPQFGLSQQLPGGTRLIFSYSMNFGIHQQRTRNINAPFPGTPLPEEILNLPRDEQQGIIDRMRPFYPIVGNIRQIESTGRSVSRDIGIRLQPRGDLPILGLRLAGNFSYNYRFGEDDNDFTNPYLREWGPSQRQHQFQSQFRIRLPEELEFSNPILRSLAAATFQNTNLNFNFRAETGRLYSITTGRDLNGDQSSRDRPPGVARNSEVGPGSWNLDMTFTKEFRIGSGNSQPNAGNLVELQRGGGRGGGDFGAGGGDFERGGGDSDRGGGGRNPFGREDGTRVRFQVRVSNLLNHSQPRAYSGVLSSPFFGQPTGYSGGRSVTLGIRLDF